MKGQIIKRRNVYTSYGKPAETIVSLDRVVSDLRFFNSGQPIDREREDVERALLNGKEIWTINSTYFLRGGKADHAYRKQLPKRKR